jgi:hypothetical protein
MPDYPIHDRSEANAGLGRTILDSFGELKTYIEEPTTGSRCPCGYSTMSTSAQNLR